MLFTFIFSYFKPGLKGKGNVQAFIETCIYRNLADDIL